VAGVPGSRGVPGAVYAPAGVNLGAILREPFPSLGVWPISTAQLRQAYGLDADAGQVARYERPPEPDGESDWFVYFPCR
jgi:hypothetical protein